MLTHFYNWTKKRNGAKRDCEVIALTYAKDDTLCLFLRDVIEQQKAELRISGKDLATVEAAIKRIRESQAGAR